jgi:uncharacterized membrane protein YtjA (UPF0391 family)
LTGFIPDFVGRLVPAGRDFVPSKRPDISGFRPLRGMEHSFRGRINPPGSRHYVEHHYVEIETEIETRVLIMLSWVVTFLIVALIAGILGFGGIAGVSIEIAKTIFFIAVVLFLVSAVVGLARGRNRV